MELLIRRATNVDATEIAKVHVSSWKSTYKGIIKDEILENITISSRTKLWERNVGQKENIVLVLEVDQKIIGFATGSPVKKEEYPTYDGDVTSIYFYEEYQRRGYGKSLLGALFTEFKKVGYNSAIVKVLDDNRSKYFYERMGAHFIDKEDVPQYGDGNVLLTYGWLSI